MLPTQKRRSFSKFSNQKAAKAFQDLSNQISDEYKTLDQYRLFYKQQKQEINKILQQKTGLQEYVEYFQKNNDVYLKIKETIKREVKYILTNPTNTKYSTCISDDTNLIAAQTTIALVSKSIFIE